MISGIISIELHSRTGALRVRTIRVLVRNARDVHDACIKGIRGAFEFAGASASDDRACIVNFERVAFDVIC